MNFDTYSRYYDLVYEDKETVREVAYLEGLLSRFAVSGRRMLDLGCGSGRHGRHLAERWDWKGIERSPEMAKRAIDSGLDVTVGALENISLQEGRFDAVTALFHVISYLTENCKLQEAFRRTNEHLVSGGLFIFDVWYSPAVYCEGAAVRVKRVEDGHTKVIRIANPEHRWNEDVIEVGYDIILTDKCTGQVREFSETHPMRHFSLPELKLLAAHHEFEWLHCEEWLTGCEPSNATWGVVCVLRKPNKPTEPAQ